MVGGNIVERKNRILLVRKMVNEGEEKWKLPSGKLNCGEEIIECAARKGFLETGYIIKPQYLVGVYQYHFDQARNVMIFVFGSIIAGGELNPGEDIVDAEWFTLPEIANLNAKGEFKTPYIYTSVIDYKKGKRVTLEAIKILE